MTPAQLQTIKDALDSERHYWRNVSTDTKELCDAEVAKIDDAAQALKQLVADHDAMSEEHATMCDQLRWRKQSEEPAPDVTVYVRSSCGVNANGEPCHRYRTMHGRAVRADEEWIPVPP